MSYVGKISIETLAESMLDDAALVKAKCSFLLERNTPLAYASCYLPKKLKICKKIHMLMFTTTLFITNNFQSK